MNAGIALSLLLAGAASADTLPNLPDTAFHRYSFVPVVASATETGVQFGALGILYFRPQGPEDPGSELDVAAMGTSRGQKCLLASPTLTSSDGSWKFLSTWKLLDWPGKYWAGGNHPEAKASSYGMKTFKGFGEFSSTLAKFPAQQGAAPHLQAILLYDLEANRTHFDSAASSVPAHTGGDRTGLGAGIAWDSRDQENWPHRGSFVRLDHSQFRTAFGGDWNFSDTRFDLRTFLPAPAGGTWALASFWEGVTGTVPFDRLPAPDGTNRMRGLERGRLCGRQEWVLQGEGRFPVAGRFSAVGFLEAAKVGDEPSFLWREDFHWATGLGGRFALNPKRGVNLRLDLSWVDDHPGVTLSFKEAF